MIKLIAIDMDGTLLDSQKKLSQENIEAIQAASRAGIKVVLCTGRPKSGILPYFEQLGLMGKEYIIMNNGCTVYETADWNLLDYRELTLEEVNQLNQALANHPQVCLTLTTEKYYYAIGDEVPDLVQYDAGLVFDTALPISIEQVSQYPGGRIFQAMYMGQAQHLDAFQQELGASLGTKFSVVRSQDYIFEAMPQGATKASALRDLAERLGFSADEIMAIGDAANDIEMLEFAKHSVAMGNASDSIKELAAYVTASNDEAGVAKAIYDYALTS